MPFLLLLLLLSLVGCGAPTHPLTYVQPDDPIWPINTPQEQAAR